ncbi:enoyl-CoA hydratase [Mycolicibacterium holsaticum]|jgi:enoyl-CoA hydratase|uniref:Enoyl-CoA hydratase n=1 Tax=Mycolicibacterium holsaticum TaxID=152142 RepID=A0A1E3RYF5_9MYCO|nr:enoyl-CoA hydratase [Mycolicibacterium holsaticum]MDA4105912.1 enoyl-CoA hydratase [Mycolicibacterium holsaticum DSM 44478 = JCM 12374]ODQ94943.1 enoyl-CoA hydratase [Mycolicibacterium holsaticum]QZA13741.1 enoyl-CoA hydratase [Mycolicibacterium holsaticum DSM 44478 = JCM 12374]UNC08797.1 enoyl-CoA hydratase [Mycolicibacterium holsaticum DSM 44478 = JCM 12374]
MTTADSSAHTYTGIDDLLVELSDGVLSVTLNRPDSLNSLTFPMLSGIADALEAAASDSRVKAVRLGGAGRGFCSGAGIGDDDQAQKNVDGPASVLDAANRAVRSIVNLPQPVVAAVHGPAAGVGVSLALACDVVLASEKAYFMLAFTKIGLMPDGGASALVAAAIGRIRAFRMALLAERISAADAYDWGLVTAVHPADEFDAKVDEMVTTLVSGPAVALRKTKHAINAATLTEFEGALGREREGQLTLLSSPDFLEGITAFHQRRPAKFSDS